MKWQDRYLPARPQWQPKDTGEYQGNVGAAEAAFYPHRHNEPSVTMWQRKVAMGRAHTPINVKRRAARRKPFKT